MMVAHSSLLLAHVIYKDLYNFTTTNSYADWFVVVADVTSFLA
jgi:hypothetical protein